MINSENQKEIREQIKECQKSIDDTIQCLVVANEIDIHVLRELLDAKEALSNYWERSDLGTNWLN